MRNGKKNEVRTSGEVCRGKVTHKLALVDADDVVIFHVVAALDEL